MASAALARVVEKRVHQKSKTTASVSESGVEADAEATKRREASATAGTCGARGRGWKEGVGRRMEGERDGGDVWSARARMEGGVGRRMEGAGKAIGGDCGRMAASAMGGADIAYRFDPMASVDGGDPRQNRAPKASVNVYISFLCSSRD
jgi:hypothetical protein